MAAPATGGHIADVAVVICAYTQERWGDLCTSVRCVEEQRPSARELIVVIDGNPRLLERARAAFTSACVVGNHHGPGASGARNTGYDHATASILAFLDDDAFPQDGWLDALAGAYANPGTLGTAGPVAPVWRAPRPRWFTDEFNWVVGCTWTGMADERNRVRNGIAVNMSVRRDVYARAGGFAQALGRRVRAGGHVTGTAEESEFCIRAARCHAGGEFVFVPAARVRHVVPAPRTTWAYFRRRCRLEGASKAILTELTGSRTELTSERRYLRSVLPCAVLRELRSGRVTGALRAGSIIAGVAYTAGSYLWVRGAVRLGRAEGFTS